MKQLATYVNGGTGYSDKTITLMNDIDLEGSETNQWTPIGNYKTNTSLIFAGTYDGNNKIISNLYINNDNHWQGLFGYNVGNIKNLVLSDINIKSSGIVGGICGQNQGTISNCGNISGEIIAIAQEARTGGVVGINCGTTQNCFNSATVKAENNDSYSMHLGGIVGFNGKESGLTGKVLNCYNTGEVMGDRYVGGIVGTVYTGSSVSKCYNIANIEGNIAVGSILGNQHIEEDGYITDNYYLEGTANVGFGFISTTGSIPSETVGKTDEKTSTYMKSSEFVNLLGASSWKIVEGKNDGYPILSWQ